MNNVNLFAVWGQLCTTNRNTFKTQQSWDSANLLLAPRKTFNLWAHHVVFSESRLPHILLHGGHIDILVEFVAAAVRSPTRVKYILCFLRRPKVIDAKVHKRAMLAPWKRNHILQKEDLRDTTDTRSITDGAETRFHAPGRVSQQAYLNMADRVRE